MENDAILDAIQRIWASEAIPPEFKLHATILGSMVAVLWGLELFDTLILRGALNRFGIRPRTFRGLQGVLLAPLLHGNLRHLATNTLPLITLAWFIMLRDINAFIIVTAVVWLISGLGVWLFGSARSNHIGASGIVFGYFGFLLLRGYFERDLVSLAFSGLVAFFYGGLIWGVLPIRRGVSWLGHAFGFGSGVFAARYLLQLQQWVESINATP
ncbi:rhomboid family intramembrane serine protease [Oculatella sp. LEGE 06141]|uniref:rhomboid family intramembrane serine protease n=1 Tax=Oculatella sp. LEGE 06141 TaxID=1828648 RepID=UPI00187E9813|nr:rhomboid family intramembrane serine protease [Oculatella sp. LEGE 06141]MBE9182010.1 rhomboid family intramembrane serine protease [Oculatella sp. LEGE 06141]